MLFYLLCLIVPVSQACEPGPSPLYLLNSPTLNPLCTDFPSLQAALETLDPMEEWEVIVQGGPQVLAGLNITHKAIRVVGNQGELQVNSCVVIGNLTLVGWDVVQLDGRVTGILTLIDCKVRGMGKSTIEGRLVIDICVLSSFQSGEIALY